MTLPPLTSLRRFDTHRLLPAKYSQNYESVLTRLVDDRSAADDLQSIFALDNATNARLLAEEGRALDIAARELVYNVPQAHVINAAFTHPNPLGARFSSSRRGAWYAAFELATSKAEVLFHKQVEFAEINWQEREEVIYDDYLADFTATFHDIREAAVDELLARTPETIAEQATLAEQVRSTPDESELAFTAEEDEAKSIEAEPVSSRIYANVFAECLSATSYVASEQLAEGLIQSGSLGIIYPSVRKPGGTCIACFRPSICLECEERATLQTDLDTYPGEHGARLAGRPQSLREAAATPCEIRVNRTFQESQTRCTPVGWRYYERSGFRCTAEELQGRGEPVG